MAQDNYNPGREQVLATATPNIVTERARMDPQANVNALLQSLGSESTQRELANFNQQYEAHKLEEQRAKVDWYVEQFGQDHKSGAVSQAQVKERFPETVPVISARIAEALGQKAGKDQMQTIVEQIANDDSLRLDSVKRAEFLAQKRAEMTATVGTGNEFYGSGLVQGIDHTIAQHEANWQTETAHYHQGIQTEQFSNEVVAALNSPKPDEALLALDAKYKTSSSLNDLERNKTVVRSAIDLAFTADDPSVLQKVPQRFLNVDSKAALVRAGVQLQDRRISDFRNAQYLKEVQRTESLRAAKTDIVGKAAAGEVIDPAAYRADPETFQFALSMREVSRVDESTSTARMQALRNDIITSSTTGTGDGTLGAWTDKIVSNPQLNPKDRKALLDDLPKLIEGRNLMADDLVRQPVTDRLNPRLQALEQSTNSAIQSLLTGRNLRSEVMKGYDLDIRRSFQAEFEETGNWPTGHRKLELVDKAVERAEKRLEDATRITGASSSHAPTAAPSAPTAVPKASAPRALPKGVTKLD